MCIGELSLFWSDHWLGEDSLCHMFSRLAGLAVEPDATVAGCFGWGGVRMLFLSYEKKNYSLSNVSVTWT
jgi:hypothetical protein